MAKRKTNKKTVTKLPRFIQIATLAGSNETYPVLFGLTKTGEIWYRAQRVDVKAPWTREPVNLEAQPVSGPAQPIRPFPPMRSPDDNFPSVEALRMRPEDLQAIRKALATGLGIRTQ